MKNIILITAGTILVNILFWNQGLGLNLLLFGVYYCISHIISKKENDNNNQSVAYYITLIGYFISSGFVILHNSLIATILSILSIVILIGLRDNTIGTIYLGVINSLTKFFQISKISKHLGFKNISNENKLKTYQSYLKLGIIPLSILSLFLIIFLNANPYFEKIYYNFIDIILNPFEDFSFSRLLFIAWSITISVWLTIQYNNQSINRFNKAQKQEISRIRRIRKKSFFSTLDLKKEYLSALIFFVMINLLLFIVNATDINSVWINFEYKYDFDISQFVHEGTYLLIISVLLSIGILGYFFRNNINFYKNNTPLKKLAYLWIVQNSVLVFSVGARNYHYINFYGLSNKRIGVFIFLVITLIALVTIGLKINQRHTLTHFIKINTWAAYITLITCCSINWDNIITDYNIQHSRITDYNYLLNLSDKTIPIIYKNKAELTTQQKTKLKHKIIRFKKDYKTNETWLSWDYASYKTNQYFNNIK